MLATLIFAEIALVGICLFPLSKLKDWVYRLIFCLLNGFFLLVFQFYLTSNLTFALLTSEITKNITLPVKKWLNNTDRFCNKFFDTEFFERNFIFLDISKSYTVNSEKGFNTRPFIVDRSEMLILLKELKNMRDEYRLVACDVYLQDLWVEKNKLDSTENELKNIIEELGAESKILLATSTRYDGWEMLDKTRIYNGNIDVSFSDNYFFCASLVNNNSSLFFPYEMHRVVNEGDVNVVAKFLGHQFNALSIDRSNHNYRPSLVTTTFIPEFYFSESEFLRKGLFIPLSLMSKNIAALKTVISRNSSEEKPIILIGSFDGIVDLHPTLYGEMHGAFIIANTYYSLFQNQHKISLLSVMFIFVSFMILSGYIIWESNKEYDSAIVKRIRNSKEKIELSSLFFLRKKEPHKLTVYLVIVIKSVFRLIFENSLYIYIFFIVVCSSLFFNRILNIIGLSVYIFCFKNLILEIIRYEVESSRQMK